MSAARAQATRRFSEVFSALGDETRLRLVGRLCDEGPLSITALSSGLPVTRQAVSRHLAVMESAGLVRGERQGREQVYRLEPARLAEARQRLAELSAEWDRRLERLRAMVES